MPDDEPVAPYTGRTSAPEPVAAEVDGSPAPRVRWGRMVTVHLAAAFLAGFAAPVVASQGDPQWILLGLISGTFVAFLGTYGLVLTAVIGIASAIGFAIWVLVAWWPRLQARPVR